MSTTIKTFSDGLRLAHLQLNSTRMVGISILCAVGSINETNETNGLSHFIEHNMFKGTKTRSAFDIANEFESLGAQINAYTSKQTTCYYALALDDKSDKCAEILADMMFNSQYAKKELDSERKVILEEISMGDDDNEGVCQDLSDEAFFGTDTQIGRTIIGTRENVKRFQKEDVLAYIADNYAAEDIVIGIAGSISLEDAIKLVDKHFVGKFKSGLGRSWADKPCVAQSRYLSKFKDIEQSHLYIATPSVTLNDDLRFANLVAKDIFGGGMSSRLFQEVREKSGLAYSVYAYSTNYINNGISQIYIGTNKDSVEKALDLTKNVILEIQKNGFTKEEIDKGINSVLTKYVLSNESTSTNMRAVASYALLYGEEYSLDRQVEKIKALTKEKIEEAFNKCFDLKNAALAYVGREVEGNLLDIIKN